MTSKKTTKATGADNPGYLDWDRARELLAPREFDILRARMEGLSLAEVAAHHCITRERVRQIEYAALKKLRTQEGNQEK